MKFMMAFFGTADMQSINIVVINPWGLERRVR